MEQNSLQSEKTMRIDALKKVDITNTENAAASVLKLADLDNRIVTALSAASDKKALAPSILDLRAVANFTDFFLIVSGTNTRQVQAIADEVVERLKKDGTRAARIEGYNTAEWILVDYGDFIVHIFDDKARQFYDLERLWREAPRVEIPKEGSEKVEK
jgi:ribosome-associated protein